MSVMSGLLRTSAAAPVNMAGAAQDGVFLCSGRRRKAQRPRKGQEPAENDFSHRDLSRRTGYPYVNSFLIQELVAGLLANLLIPGRRSQGLIITCVIGIAGALLGGWLATRLFHVHTLHGFFNLSTWLTAIAGAAILLLAFHLVTSRGAGRTRRGNAGRSRRRPGWAHR